MARDAKLILPSIRRAAAEARERIAKWPQWQRDAANHIMGEFTLKECESCKRFGPNPVGRCPECGV